LDPGFGGFVLIQGSLTGPTTLEDQLSRLVGAFSGLPDFQEVSRTSKGGDVPRYIIGVEWSIADMPFRGDFTLSVKGARAFSIGAIALKELFDQYQPGFRQVADSFQITLAPTAKAIDPGAGSEKILDAIGERVTTLRGLPALLKLERGLQTRQEFETKAVSELLDEETRLETERLKDLCVVLDLCSLSDDLLQLRQDLLSQGVLGYYRPEKKSLTVVTGQDSLDPLSWLTYAHEYTHALQDQQFDLSAMERKEDTFDSSKAVLALVEGDANLSEYLFYESLPPAQQALLTKSLEEQILDFSRSPEVARAPRIFKETFGWEHSVGPDFVFRLYLKGGFDAINRAYQDPPQSTEQVLHPEKYLTGEAPLSVDLPDLAKALGNPWQQRDKGVLGELLTNVYLGTFLTGEQASAAAQGWGGDRYALLKDDQSRILIAIRSSWDTEEDAAEFFQAYLDLAGRKSQGRWQLVETGDNLRLWVGKGISVHLSLKSASTLVVIGPERNVVEAVLKSISSSTLQK